MNFSNGLSIGTKIKPKQIRFHIDFNRRLLRSDFFLTPYLRFDVERAETKVATHLGSILFWRNLKYNTLLHLSETAINLQHRAEFIRKINEYTIHAALVQDLDLKKRQNVSIGTQVAVSRDNFEGSVRCEKKGEGIFSLEGERIQLGVAYNDKKEFDLAASLEFNPLDIKSTKTTELTFGGRHRLGDSCSARATYRWFSQTATLQAQYISGPNLTLTGTLEVNRSKDAPRGFGQYPFNFGVQAAFNA